MCNIRRLIEFLLGFNEKDIHDFMTFAIDEDYRIIEYKYYPLHWNLKHSEKLFLNETGRPFDDIPKMIEIWEDSKKD
jgi:hypothetical protein